MTRRGTTRALSVAPMMDHTDRHDRFFLRCITKHTLLYTEMVHARAVLRGDRDYLIGYSAEEHPLALQLGGDNPEQLAECARIAEGLGYDEVNLNIGCPSPRVQSGNFGACLMAQPEVVARAVEAMRAACTLPITVKHRIGIDDIDTYEHMLGFVDQVAQAGADRFTVHARKAWLQGLSPKQNRTVPPLRHDEVHRLKRERPHLIIETNGGIQTLDDALGHLQHVDAVMLGRAAMNNPWVLAHADKRIFGSADEPPTRAEVVHKLMDYAGQWQGHPRFKIHHLTRHIMPLFVGLPGAKVWRRELTEGANRKDAGPVVLSRALERVQEVIERAA